MKAKERDQLLDTLQARFEQNMHRHPGVPWAKVRARLEAAPGALRTLQQMEASGGEPDVVGEGDEADGFVFVDCSPESPAGRRSTCFDEPARAARKENR